jgi:hypothetical protein
MTVVSLNLRKNFYKTWRMMMPRTSCWKVNGVHNGNKVLVAKKMIKNWRVAEILDFITKVTVCIIYPKRSVNMDRCFVW